MLHHFIVVSMSTRVCHGCGVNNFTGAHLISLILTQQSWPITLTIWLVCSTRCVRPSVWWPCYPYALLYKLARYSRRTLLCCRSKCKPHLHVNMCHYSLFLDRSKKHTLEILPSPFKGTCPCLCAHMCVCVCVVVCVCVYLCVLACTWWVYVSLPG